MTNRENLATLICTEKRVIECRWLTEVREQIEKSRPHADIVILNSLPKYLEDVAQSLLEGDERVGFHDSVRTAKEHGQTRVALGYSVRDVVTEYSIFREVIVDLAADRKLLSADALKCLNRIQDAGSIIAVEEFLEKSVISRERDARLMAEASEAYFRNLIDSLPAMVWMTDANSLCIYLSKQWSEITGRSIDQDLGVGWLEAIHPDDLANTANIYTQAVKDKGPLRTDYRLRNHLGEYRWAIDLGFPRFDKSNKFIGYIGTVTDIHDRIALERELRSSQNRFERSAAATDLGIFYCDLPFSDLIWNREVKNHFFLPAEAHVTIDTFYDRIIPDDRETTRLAINTSIVSRKPYVTVFRTWDPANPGPTKHIKAIGWTDYDGNGKAIRFDGITLDVTEQIRINQELRDAKASAEDANAAKSAFLANMSHEIRTPLGAIMGYSDLAREPGASHEEITAHLAVVERNSTQVLRIIDDILDLAKVEAGRVELEVMDVPLTEYLADFASLFGFRARENGIAFHIHAETDLPRTLRTDPTRLRQILTNSVGNAIKFTSKGSVELKVRFDDGLLQFGIEDTGRGISDEQAANLFQAFVQADVSTTRKFGGTGLGLVLTKRLCQLMGGDYELISSQLNVGSKFRASVRVDQPSASQVLPRTEITFDSSPRSKSQSAHGRLQGVSVLLIEDSPDNQLLLKLILERQGARLDIVGNGALGVEKAISADFDIVLMDIQMPVMDGHAAVRALRAKDYTKPVVALTAHAMKEEVDRAMESGFTSFLSKPIQRESLITLITNLTNL